MSGDEETLHVGMEREIPSSLGYTDKRQSIVRNNVDNDRPHAFLVKILSMP